MTQAWEEHQGCREQAQRELALRHTEREDVMMATQMELIYKSRFRKASELQRYASDAQGVISISYRVLQEIVTFLYFLPHCPLTPTPHTKHSEK